MIVELESLYQGVKDLGYLLPHLHQIVDYQCSESAFIFFAHRQDDPSKEVAIKILRECDDTRYNLTDARTRWQCQIEALRWNRLFTPEIEMSLCLVRDVNLDLLPGQLLSGMQPILALGDPIIDPDLVPNLCVPNTNYALVMDLLPQERRLDNLLKDTNLYRIKRLLEALVKRVVRMHEHTLIPSDFYDGDNGMPWGSYKQLEKKSDHNISLFQHLRLKNAALYRKYRSLEDMLEYAIDCSRLQEALEARWVGGHIKRCHGDLKARNIWIEAKSSSQSQDQCVRILDAIDFNPSYSNIDVLSDIAMLAIDVQTIYKHKHGRCGDLANFILDTYLALTQDRQQDNEETRLVLSYYLLEKAIVRAAIGLCFDHHDPESLGICFLETATECVADLNERLGTSTAKASYSKMLVAV